MSRCTVVVLWWEDLGDKTCKEMGCCYSCNKDDSAQVLTTTHMPLELLILNVDSSFAFETVFRFNYHRHKTSRQCQELVI